MEVKGAPQTTPTKRLLFDRRYGWVIDEWKPPADEALAGGRGMFCILPLAKGLIQTATYSLNMVTNSAVQILEKRDGLSLQHFQANVGNQLQQLGASVSKPVGSLLTFKDKLFLPANSSSPQHMESNNMQEPQTA
ncbi:uncharacterized protein LOC141596399 [Silene latifolia]|uniref:uncharacterized protein LOC141596399 n=1 Tax=Silene latifolia TaxID=37657 RepID=UPI003D773EB1